MYNLTLSYQAQVTSQLRVCSRSSSQPVDILLVSGNLSVSSEEQELSCKRLRKNLIICSNILVSTVSFYCKLFKMIIQAFLLMMAVASDTFVTSLLNSSKSLFMRVSGNKICHFKENTNFTFHITVILYK